MNILFINIINKIQHDFVNKNLFVILFLWSFSLFSQNSLTPIIKNSFTVVNNTIKVDNVSISPFYFKLLTSNQKEISSTKYTVDFAKAIVVFNDDYFNGKTVTVHFKALPDFLTKTYTALDENLIVDHSKNQKLRFYQLKTDTKTQKNLTIFNSLETTGHISRGITVGNNQDGVVNSGLKLQLSGKLSRKVNINANITDNNVPLQDNGYTQRLNEYDRVFIELFSDKWKLTAGDLFLNNTQSDYLNFNKKVAGLGVDVHLKGVNSQTNIYTSGAVVKGAYKSVDFNGQEANQGPYRLANVNNQYLIIIQGSETVYVNGIQLSKEEYIMDYSASEITFNTTYPVNSNMRIHIEFQASEQNYTRFVSYNKVDFKKENFSIGVNFYSENDSKSKNLQQDLNDLQIETLYNAGDNLEQMYTLSAIEEEYIEDKIQYKKEMINGVEAFMFSSNQEDDLYSVKFTYVGTNKGDYIIENTIATGRIYQYVSPINGIKQGDYEPKIQLVAPKSLQVTTLKSAYKSKKTNFSTELAFSNKDDNLFSKIDDDNNQSFAGNLVWNQLLIDKKWKLVSQISYEQIQKDFNSVERIKNIEFNRDWNVTNIQENQSLLVSHLSYENEKNGKIAYQYENLDLSHSFSGNRHGIISDVKINNTKLNATASLMNSNSDIEISTFTKYNTLIQQQFKHFLVGVKLDGEHNLRANKQTKLLNDLSFKNNEYAAFFSIKDSVRTKLEVGYRFIANDSLQNTSLQNVNKANNYYLKSDIIKNKSANLSVFLNYREFTNLEVNNEKSLNSKVNYRQQFFDNFFQFNTVYETSSGTIPQQEYSYIEVDSGKGYYTWNDYNNDGIQDLDEFEVAQFQDEAIYVRVLLPSTKFLRTNQTKFSQLLTINPSKWGSHTGILKYLSHFINQTNFNVDNKQLKTSDFQLNPFDKNEALSLQYNFKNFLFFNRGKQHYSFTYSYLQLDNKTVFITGLQENNLISNQLQFSHKIISSWLIDFQGVYSNTKNTNERYVSRNMDLDTKTFIGKISYLFPTNNSSVGISYQNNNKQNNSILEETLNANNFGVLLQYNSKKDLSLNASFNYIENKYSGNQNDPIAYQLLEGLQKGKNYTWSLILQKKLTNYLNINLNYHARKTEILKTIHTGTIQLRANF
jgi:hypothetical protein